MSVSAKSVRVAREVLGRRGFTVRMIRDNGKFIVRQPGLVYNALKGEKAPAAVSGEELITMAGYRLLSSLTKGRY
jgi:hypothetical protein